MFKYIQYIFFLIVFGLFFSIWSCIPASYGTSYSPFDLASTLDDDDDDDDDDEDDEDEDDEDEDEDDEDDDDDDDDEDVDDGEILNNQQIPYNMKLDTMAFISCPSDRVDFKFKMASIYEGGIELKSFLREKSEEEITEREIKKYPYYRSEPFLGFVEPTSPHHIATWSSGGLDFSGGKKFNEPKTVHSYLDSLIESPGFLKTKGELRGRSADEEYISVEFSDFYSALFDDLFLFIGFRNKNTPHVYETPEEELYIHGRYYEVSLDEDDNERKFLSEVIENPETTSYDWDCDDDYLFEIRRHEDNVPSTEAQKKRFTDEWGEFEDELTCPEGQNNGETIAIERMLDDKWNVNLEEKCVSPKSKTRNLCYQRGVSRVGPVDDCRSNSIPNRCPHFLSICFRDSREFERYSSN